MARVATRVILGDNLQDQGYSSGLVPAGSLVHVKAPVFSFTKLNKVDSLLGPEMKSTGEVMGTDQTLAKALYKAFEGTKIHVPQHGTILFTVRDEDKREAVNLARRFHELGYQLVATRGIARTFKQAGLWVQPVAKITEDTGLLDQIKQYQIQVVINTISTQKASAADGALIRQTAIAHAILY